MSAEVDQAGQVDYRARRAGQPRESRYLYRAAGKTAPADEGSLEFFLLERYRLFAHDSKNQRLLTGRVWHMPYRIGAAEAPVWDDVMLQLEGFPSPGRAPDHICATEPVNVRVFSPERVTASPSGA